jgi:hypothetical protein
MKELYLMKYIAKAACFMPFSFVANFSIKRKEAAYSSETLVGFQQTTRLYTSDYRNIHNQAQLNNLKSCIMYRRLRQENKIGGGIWKL